MDEGEEVVAEAEASEDSTDSGVPGETAAAGEARMESRRRTAELIDASYPLFISAEM